MFCVIFPISQGHQLSNNFSKNENFISPETAFRLYEFWCVLEDGDDIWMTSDILYNEICAPVDY